MFFNNKIKKEIFLGLFISILIIFFVFATFFIGKTNFLRTIGSYFDDIFLYQTSYFSKVINSEEVNNNIVIVKIDDKTLNSLQKGDLKILSFSKKIYSDFLEKIFTKYNAKIAGLDIVFSNKSTYGEEDENNLKDSFEKYKDKVVIATRGDKKEIPLCKYSNIQHGASEWVVENITRKFNIYFSNYNLQDCIGNNLYEGNKNGIYSFSVEIYKKYINSLNPLLSNNFKITLSNFLEQQKLENNNEFYSRFFNNTQNNNPQESGVIGFKSYSLIDILDGKDYDDFGNKIDLSGKIVLLGEVGTLLHDRQFSPISFNFKMSGIEFHANAIETIMKGIQYEYEKNRNVLSGNKLSFLEKNTQVFLYKIDVKYIITILIFTIILLYILVIKTRVYISLMSLLILFILHAFIGFVLFDLGYIYPVFFFIYSLIIGFIFIYLYKYITIDKQKSFIKKAFSMFLSPEMVEIISNDPSKLNLKGEKGNLTVFFSDIADFTSISEKMEAEDLFNYLNEYFSVMMNILTKNKGTLDKYIGDSVMGFFNAPLKVEEHEYLACKTALEQQRALVDFNKQWGEKGYQEIKIRIGINSGITIHGNLGSKEDRINYTVIGDNVNLASRLEGINKQYGTLIIIGETTYNKIKDRFITRELDIIKLKGKQKPTKIFELIGFKGEKFSEELFINYENGLKLYYKGDYINAIKEFEKNENDMPSIKMKERCELAKDGKIEIIDGIFKMSTK